MKTLEVSQATEPLRDYVGETASDTLVLTKNGKPVAAVVSLKGVDRETLSLSTSPKFLAILRKSRRSLKTKGGISLGEMRRRVGVGR